MTEKVGWLRVAPTKQTQPATFAETGATIAATDAQPGSLKALARLVSLRNQERNHGATLPEKPRNFDPEKPPEKLRKVAGGNAPAVHPVAGREDGGLVPNSLLSPALPAANASPVPALAAKAGEHSPLFALGVAVPDDRRKCADCANLAHNGRCSAAGRGEIVAARNYRPVLSLPRRCEGYAPGPDDADRRPGRERWPGLDT